MKTLIFAAATVLGLTRSFDESVPREDFIYRACAEWKLAAEDVQFFFAHADTISAQERQHRFEINGGSFGVLLGTSATDASYYGCKDRCARLFPFHLYGDE